MGVDIFVDEDQETPGRPCDLHFTHTGYGIFLDEVADLAGYGRPYRAWAEALRRHASAPAPKELADDTVGLLLVMFGDEMTPTECAALAARLGPLLAPPPNPRIAQQLGHLILLLERAVRLGKNLVLSL